MNCKNCENSLAEEADYCQSCGAKVVTKRLTVKGIFLEFLNKVFGWDNTYLRTFRTMVVAPDKVAKDYIDGVRKKFMPPFTFLLIGLTIATLVFNSFSDKYAELSFKMVNESFNETMFSNIERLDKEKPESYFTSEEYNNKYIEYRDAQIKTNKKYSEFIIRYFNIMVFLFMPLYTYMAFLTFGRKRYNYGEHLVINSYIQGFSMISSMLFFVLSFLVSPSLYPLSILITIFYYLFVYKKMYEISWATSLVKLLKFLGILILTLIILLIVVLIGAIIIAIAIKFFK